MAERSRVSTYSVVKIGSYGQKQSRDMAVVQSTATVKAKLRLADPSGGHVQEYSVSELTTIERKEDR